MKKHLHYYTQHSQYVEPTDKPAVSYCKQEDEVHYAAAESVTLITFTIASKSYQAEEGMTWQQWVDSSYNVVEDPYTGENSINNGNFFIKDNMVKITTTLVSCPHVTDTSHTSVTPQDTIVANYSYLEDSTANEFD